MKVIQATQPIGRRSLTQMVGLTERVLRAETDFIKQQGLLQIASSGMSLTPEGVEAVTGLRGMMRELLGLKELEQQLEQLLSVNQVIVVPGDSSEEAWVKHDLGRAAVEQMSLLAEEKWNVAVAGGTTMAAVAEVMKPSSKLKSLVFLPARGGLGEEVENQANTITSKMAQQSGGSYRMLHIPDQLSKEAYESLTHDPHIKDVIRQIRSSRMIVHGIGEARTMALRRKSTKQLLQSIEERQAVAEAFGYYFSQQGEIVEKIQTVGLRLEDVQQADHIIAVAGGRAKARAIRAFLMHGTHDVLITDEGAAREMIQLCQPETEV
ncbi:central glycolytic genes regulator [Bacillus horti]|uniref:Central glycolytic genes regulator n=2 Tax=Caldalkalibacillus horti TaxID=77523 RepID=A0ABT9W386_9BACI|nr:central glycolytic genes regulator [Bacillus horti]